MKFAVAQPDYDLAVLSNPEHIRKIDYLRPAIGISVYFTVYAALAGTITMLLAPRLAPWVMIGCVGAIIVAIPMFLAMAAAYGYTWRKRLREDPHAFCQYVDLPVTAAQALELCLAAVGQLPNSKIEGLDEAQMQLTVRAKGNFWITVDRLVRITVEPIGATACRITALSGIKLSRARTWFIKGVWGQRWYPVVMSIDFNKNKKLLKQIYQYIESVPNWDHAYLPMQASDQVTKDSSSARLSQATSHTD